MKLFLAFLLVVATVVSGAGFSHAGYSRGPYFPKSVAVPGRLIDQWEPTEFADRDPSSSGRPFGLTGVFTLTETLQGFELGYAVYSCKEIDDGAYGAMSCDQSVSPSYITLKKFSSCPVLSPRAAGCI